MKRKHKRYSNPKKPFDKSRIDEEKKIREEFGLKNKKEIWKAEAKVKLVREKARKLIKSPPEKQKVLFKLFFFIIKKKIFLKTGVCRRLFSKKSLQIQ